MDKGYIELEFAKLDVAREKRRGFPEIIYAPSKTCPQLKKIVNTLKRYTDRVFISKLEQGQYNFLKRHFPSLRYFREARIGFLGKESKERRGYVVILTGGTADIPIAEEAAVFLELVGNRVERIYDVGVAGLHRIWPFKKKLDKAKVVIVAAGMEAALASIVSGLVKSPVVAVPTSVGYGAHLYGLASLLSVLNSCSPGVVVVNIDNGLGAGYFANLINK
jgi:hypothetical protein